MNELGHGLSISKPGVKGKQTLQLIKKRDGKKEHGS
jgi:hypothetical protein